MKQKLLIFGVTGEIGGRVARLACDAGFEVHGVSRGVKKRRQEVDPSGITLHAGDKYDEAFLSSLADSVAPTAIVDTIPNEKISTLFQKHFPMAENVLFCSSTGTFVPLQSFPADENHPWREQTAYNFFFKSQVDIRALELYKEKGFPVTILRPSNIIGEGTVPLELWGGRCIRFFQDLKAGRPVTITDCESILIQSGYHWDLAGAFLQALEHPDAIRGEIFIISAKRAITLGKYLETAMDFLHSKSEIRHVSPEELCRTNPDVTREYGLDFLLQHMCLDISKAERVFGYAPGKTTEEGLVSALSWCEQTGLL